MFDVVGRSDAAPGGSRCLRNLLSIWNSKINTATDNNIPILVVNRNVVVYNDINFGIPVRKKIEQRHSTEKL